MPPVTPNRCGSPSTLRSTTYARSLPIRGRAKGQLARLGADRDPESRSDGSPFPANGCSGELWSDLDRRFFEDVDAAGGAQADHVGKADLGFLDLAIASLSAKVMADFPDVGDAGGRDGVALGLQPARYIHRRRAVAPGCT